MADAVPPPRSRLGVIGLVTLVGSAFIGFNTLVTSCASENVVQNAAQLHAIEENERFWTAAMQELSDIVKDKDQPASNFAARCKLLARRAAPFSVTSSTPRTDAAGTALSGELSVLSERVGKLQAEFATQIRDPAIVGPGCSGEFDQRNLVDQKKRRASTAVANAVTAADPNANVSYGSIVARDDLITLSGTSAKGIDVDVYWCDSAIDDQATRNFKAALLLGQRLAGYATTGEKLTSGAQSDPVGQVQVRLLPRALLMPGRDYARAVGRNVLRGRARVQPFMQALAADAKASAIEGLGSWSVVNTGRDGPNWYVAAAICGAGAIIAAPAVNGGVTR